MTIRSLIAIFVTLACLALLGAYKAFDFYIDQTAGEMMNAFLRTEATTLQQGNLLNSITKLQSAVEGSDSLRGVAVFDRSLDPNLNFPLILLGKMPSIENYSSSLEMRRTGAFSRIYLKRLDGSKVLTFHFDPRFVLWSYSFFGIILSLFSIAIAYLGRLVEGLRAKERTEALHSVWRQISHDIKSPLSALKIFAHNLRQSSQDTQLLDLGISRIESILGDLKLRSQRADDLYRSDNLFRIDNSVKEVISEKSIEFPDHKILVESHASAVVRGNEGQFKRVLSNIMNNAVEASSPEQPISIRLEQRGSKIELKCRDHGTGIPREIQSKLFARGMSFGKRSGSGLGLYHARKVISAMGGSLNLVSEPGVGTEVTISLAQPQLP